MKDSCICPNCNTKLDVTEYGYGLKCSECGCKIDIFPDTTLYLETMFGNVGISLLNGEDIGTQIHQALMGSLR